MIFQITYVTFFRPHAKLCCIFVSVLTYIKPINKIVVTMFISPMDFFQMQHLTVSLIESQGDKSSFRF